MECELVNNNEKRPAERTKENSARIYLNEGKSENGR